MSSVAAARLAVAEDEARWSRWGVHFVWLEGDHALLVIARRNTFEYRFCSGKSWASMSREAALQLLGKDYEHEPSSPPYLFSESPSMSDA